MTKQFMRQNRFGVESGSFYAKIREIQQAAMIYNGGRNSVTFQRMRIQRQPEAQLPN
jgi:hypothetical protein